MFNPIQEKKGLLYMITVKNKEFHKTLYSVEVNTL